MRAILAFLTIRHTPPLVKNKHKNFSQYFFFGGNLSKSRRVERIKVAEGLVSIFDKEKGYQSH